MARAGVLRNQASGSMGSGAGSGAFGGVGFGRLPDARRTTGGATRGLFGTSAPGTFARLGFDWPRLHALNPRLIFAQVKGFSPESPHANYLAFDMIAQAMGGTMGINGHPDQPPTGSSEGWHHRSTNNPWHWRSRDGHRRVVRGRLFGHVENLLCVRSTKQFHSGLAA